MVNASNPQYIFTKKLFVPGDLILWAPAEPADANNMDLLKIFWKSWHEYNVKKNDMWAYILFLVLRSMSIFIFVACSRFLELRSICFFTLPKTCEPVAGFLVYLTWQAITICTADSLNSVPAHMAFLKGRDIWTRNTIFIILAISSAPDLPGNAKNPFP